MAAILIFAITYLVLAIGRLPGFRIDRTGAAIIGASFMVGVNALSLNDAYAAINFDTIILLFGMMIVVANLQLSGFFALIAERVVEHAHSPVVLLMSIVAVAGFFSAFFVNDTMCLVLTPLVLEIARALERNPVPYLLAVAMASNIGSVATITGNPQNMIIGAISHIPYTVFATVLAPVAVAGLVLVFVVICVVARGELRDSERLVAAPPPARAHKPQMIKAALVTFGVVGLFFAGVPVAEAAILGGALLLVTRAIKARKVYREIDGALLLMFAGLFVVTAGAEKALLSPNAIAAVHGMHLENVWALTGVTAVLSNIISNVPAVLALKPFVPGLADEPRAWLTIAMSATLAGNLTLVGSIANLIVAERARAAGIEISFFAYCRAGIPLTLLTLALGAWWLS
jgi:Na+/H+ antiporter NhaD/arsenite permease-like protein